MRNLVSRFSLCAFIVLLLSIPIRAEDKMDAVVTAAERANNTSFIWLQMPKVGAAFTDEHRAAAKERFQILNKAFEANALSDSIEDLDGVGFVVPFSVQNTEEWLRKQELTAKIAPYRIERNQIMHLFGSSCDDSMQNYAGESPIPWGVLYVSGGSAPGDFTTTTKAAWIIDSGIAEYSPEINVKIRLDCTTRNCPTDTKAKKDPVGHGR
jgi:hypothetical protein